MNELRDLLQRHYQFVHKDIDDPSGAFNDGSPQRRPIACTTCARAKTKCDKAVRNPVSTRIVELSNGFPLVAVLFAMSEQRTSL